MTDTPALSDADRLKILEAAVREAMEVYLRYIDPMNGVSRDEALNGFIAIFDRPEVAQAAGVTIGPRLRLV